MHVRVVTPPEPIVTWAEAKKHLRLDGDEEQGYVETLITAATGWIDGPGGWLGRAIGAQTLELVDCGFGNDRLPYPPVVEIESIVYLDRAGVEQTMAEADYRLMLNGSVTPVSGQSWPVVSGDPEAVRIRYVAGYPMTEGEAPASTVPVAIKQAILLLIGHWFANRETVVVGTITAQMPFAVEALLSTYRVWSV